MSNNTKILAFAGSTREDSFNKKLVKVAGKAAQDSGASVTYVDLREYPLPIFDEDLEGAEGLPANAKALKQIFKEHDAFIISSPEYNSSISAVLKNTIDWISRPSEDSYPLEAFKGKVAAIMSASPGGLGGLRGLVHIRSILSSIHVTVIPDQIAVGSAFEAFDEKGNLKDEKLAERVQHIGSELASVSAKLKKT